MQFFEKEFLKEDANQAGAQGGLSSLKKLDIRCSASGNGALVVGDDVGSIYIMDKQMRLTSFPAFEKEVLLLFACRKSDFLYSVGHDKDAKNVIRLWQYEKVDKAGFYFLHKAMNFLSSKYSETEATAIEVEEDLGMLALGLSDGTMLLVRGDIKAKDPRPPLKFETYHLNEGITGLRFAKNGKASHLFIVTVTSTHSMLVHPAGGSPLELSSTVGALPGCIAFSDEQSIVVTTEMKVQFFQVDTPAQLLPFEPLTPVKLSWFKGYFFVSFASRGGAKDSKVSLCQIYDLNNRFIAFSHNLPPIQHVLCEWGAIYLITEDHKMIKLEERDTTQKLESLYRRGWYPVALKLAESQRQDPSLVTDIHRRYGDHLYSKGGYDTAIDEYTKTIGRLEPSYVIRRFLEPQRIKNLTTYLQALHKAGLASADHTTLLLNCYTKLKDVQHLDEFINQDKNIRFNVETAIRVLRQAEYTSHARTLAYRWSDHERYLKIQLEDEQNCRDALAYLMLLPFIDTKKYMIKYGTLLVHELPNETTLLLKELCTGYNAHPRYLAATKEGQKDIPILSDPQLLVPADASDLPRADAEDFIHIYVNEPHWLTEFLEFVVAKITSSPIVYNTLLELYLREGDEQVQGDNRSARLEKAYHILLQHDLYDHEQALILVRMKGFDRGLLHLLTQMKLYEEIIQYHMERDDYAKIIETCNIYGESNPNLWVTVLSYFAHKDDCASQIAEVLDQVDHRGLLSPLIVVQILQENENIKISLIRDYIKKKLLDEQARISDDSKQIKQYSDETQKMREEIEEMKTSAVVFQLSKCSQCALTLDLPAVHFLCRHSMHLRCMGDNEKECPKCATANRQVLDIKRSLAKGSQGDQFFQRLSDSNDGFSIISEYFGRGMFSRTVEE